MEIQDLLQWLEHTDLRLSSSKTVWGMPDSAGERLSAHLVMLQAVRIVTQICRACILLKSNLLTGRIMSVNINMHVSLICILITYA